MGLFDFFKKKTLNFVEPEYQQPAPQIDRNFEVLLAFEAQLIEMGYEVERHPKHIVLIINGELELGFMIVDVPGAHPNLMQLMVSASHLKYFPDGIIEPVMGAGETLEEKIDFAMRNYINCVFLAIMDGFAESHRPEFDFMAMLNGREVLQHPKLGDLTMQGQWEEPPQGEPLFELLKDDIPEMLTANKINWLKIYISKRTGGEIIGECNFNNEPWDAATRKIYEYAESWEMPGKFKGLKQFIMFRRCDAYDETAD